MTRFMSDKDVGRSLGQAEVLKWKGQTPLTTSFEIYLSAPRDELTHLHLRWNEAVAEQACYASAMPGSAAMATWAWRSLVPERADAVVFCYRGSEAAHRHFNSRIWRQDRGRRLCASGSLIPRAVSLWLDVSNGGNGVSLGGTQAACGDLSSFARVRLEKNQSAAFASSASGCARSRDLPPARYTARMTGITLMDAVRKS